MTKKLSHAKICDLCMEVCIKEYVLWLEVTMDDAFSAFLMKMEVQRTTLHVLIDKKPPSLFCAESKQAHQIDMIDQTDGANLGTELLLPVEKPFQPLHSNEC